MGNERLKTLLPIALTAIGFGLAAIIATARPQPEPNAMVPPPPPQVEVQTVIPGTAILEVRTQGSVAPRR